MEQPGVVAGNFAPSFLLNFLSIFVHISGSIRPFTLIWASLERCFPPAQVEYRWCQFWSKGMTSEVKDRPRLIKAGYGRHGNQWVKQDHKLNLTCLHACWIIQMRHHWQNYLKMECLRWPEKQLGITHYSVWQPCSFPPPPDLLQKGIEGQGFNQIEISLHRNTPKIKL